MGPGPVNRGWAKEPHVSKNHHRDTAPGARIICEKRNKQHGKRQGQAPPVGGEKKNKKQNQKNRQLTEHWIHWREKKGSG